MTAGGAKALTAFVARGDLKNSDFRALVEALPVAIYTTDAQGRLTYFNAAATKLSGRVPELGTDKWCVTWKIFLPDGTPLPHNQCPMAIALKGVEVPTGIECMAERPDGTRFWFTPCPAVVRDAEGLIIGGINLLIDITDRRNAETEATEQFRAIVETTPECVKIIAPDGTLLFMNTPGLAMVGACSAEEVTGKNVYDIIAPEDRDRFRAFNKRICQGEKASLQFDIVGLKGVRRHMETHAAPLRHHDGTTVHLGITHDITERKRAEQAALLLSAIIDSSDDAIISKDLNGVITSWNNSAERMFGYTAAETVGQPITILIPVDRLDEEPEILARLRRGERVNHFETVRRRKDGALLDISLTISPVRDLKGTIIGASKIARDISESKRIREALLASEARFRQLADTMPQIVWTARPDGYVDYYNERWYEYTGFGGNAFGDESWESVLHPEDVRKRHETYYAAISSGQPYSVEYRLMDRKEARWRWFVERAVPVRDESGKIVKWFGTSTDINEQKRAQDELRRANEDLEQFSFSATHDLQEPLRTVKIYSELLASRHSDTVNEEARKFVTFIRNGATRMEMLVRDLLAYTQVAKMDKPGGETADANEALNNALANLAGSISESGAKISADPLPTIRVHGMHLQRVFQNLIGNAIKYSGPQRQPIVHVGAKLQDGNWIFTVSDNGIGIAPEYTEKIFGLFKRLHNSEEYSGTGIGLAICKRIVEGYRGRIWAESEPGHGSVFRFRLPV
jgi:PAS domain S-box-containing protein